MENEEKRRKEICLSFASLFHRTIMLVVCCFSQYRIYFVQFNIFLLSFMYQQFPWMSSELTNDNELPLHSAAKQGHSKLVRLLLNHDYKALTDQVSFILQMFEMKVW